MSVVVKQDHDGATTSTIATYKLSGCYFFLLDGNYADGVDTKPFAYLYHHSTYIEPDTMPLIYILAFFK
jgi:hypothetical protein